MNAVIKYIIDTENEIIYHSYIGDIEAKNLVELDLDLSSNPDYSSAYDQIHDLRYCNLLINPNEIDGYIDFLENQVKINKSRNEIYLTNKPNQVALSTLYSSSLDKLHIQGHVHSTIESVIKTLPNKNLQIASLEKILDSLREPQLNDI